MKPSLQIAGIVLIGAVLFISTTASAQVVASEEALVGTWAVDMQAMLTEMAADVPEDQRAMVEAMIEGASMQLTLNADYTLNMVTSMMGETESENATWSVVSTEGSTMVIRSLSEEGETTDVTFVFVDQNSATATAEGETMVLNRVAAE